MFFNVHLSFKKKIILCYSRLNASVKQYLFSQVKKKCKLRYHVHVINFGLNYIGHLKKSLQMLRNIIAYQICIHVVTLQWPFDLSSMMQPDGRFLHFTRDASMLSSTLSTDTSTIAHWSALNCLQCRIKYTSLVGTNGVSICSSANICDKF